VAPAARAGPFIAAESSTSKASDVACDRRPTSTSSNEARVQGSASSSVAVRRRGIREPPSGDENTLPQAGRGRRDRSGSPLVVRPVTTTRSWRTTDSSTNDTGRSGKGRGYPSRTRELPATRRMAQLAERVRLDLADPFARQPNSCRLSSSVRGRRRRARAEADDPLPRALELSRTRLICSRSICPSPRRARHRVLVSMRLPKLRIAFVADRRLERDRHPA